MSLVEFYRNMKGSIVAFAEKYPPPGTPPRSPSDIPTIFGTGFVIREDGLVVTNNHVIEYGKRLVRSARSSGR